MDPLRFNYLLWLWDKVNQRAADTLSKGHLDKVEQAVSQFVRQQQVINELKRISGCDKDNA